MEKPHPAILLVKEKWAFQQKLAELLAKDGATISEAFCEEDALEWLKANTPDLIITRRLLGDPDGFDFLGALLKDNRTKNIPVIVLNFFSGEKRPVLDEKKAQLGLQWLENPAVIHSLRHAVALQLQEKSRYPVLVITDTQEGGARLQPWQLDAQDGKRLPIDTVSISQSITLSGGGQTINPSTKAAASAGSLSAFVKDTKEMERRLRNAFFCTRLELLSGQATRSRTFENLQPSLEAKAKQIAESFGREGDLNLDIQEHFSLINDHHFERLISELLDNAFRFSAPGDRVQVRWYINLEDAYLTVQNTGDGIDEDKLNDLKKDLEERFPSRQRAHWGLRVVTKIAQLYHAQLSLTSGLGQGMLVELRFPGVASDNPSVRKAAVTGVPFSQEEIEEGAAMEK